MINSPNYSAKVFVRCSLKRIEEKVVIRTNAVDGLQYNELIACETPLAHVSTSDEEHSSFRELLAGCAKRHDIICLRVFEPLGDEQQLPAEEQLVRVREADAGDRLESECGELVQRHRCLVCECDEFVGIGASGREVAEFTPHIDGADSANAVVCTHFE